MNILALDTAFGEVSAAVRSAKGDFFSTACSEKGKTRSTMIVPLLDQLLTQAELEWSELNLLALGAGPGAFTGLRIGAATLAGINSGLKLPILHLSSLSITAVQSQSSASVWVLEDARAGEVFVGHYLHGKVLSDDRCLRWSEVENDIEAGVFVCHNEPPAELIGWSRKGVAIGRSEALLQAVLTELESVELSDLPQFPEPVYLQRSQAEKNIYG